MSRIIVISYSKNNAAQTQTLISDLQHEGLHVWNFDEWIYSANILWQSVEEQIEYCKAVVTIVSLSASISPQAQRVIKYANDKDIPIIPVLIEDDASNSSLGGVTRSNMIDISSDDNYRLGLQRLSEKLFSIFGIDPKSKHQIIEDEIQNITLALTEVRWIRIIHIDGLAHPTYRFDAAKVKHDTPIEREEDRLGPMGVISLSLSERVCSEAGLGNSRFTVIAGKSGTHFLFPIGDGAKWLLSFAVKGHPSVDKTVQYFEDRNYLAHIVPLIGKIEF